jgi:hypothetical protein
MADRKPKAKGVPPSKAAPPLDQKPQRERFIEAAKEAGVTDESFDKAIAKVAPTRKR